MARKMKAYSISEAIVEFMDRVHGWKQSIGEIKERIHTFADMLLNGEKGVIITMLKCDVDYDSHAVDLLELIYDF